MTKIRTRFAPSPTGDLHIGGLRTALYSYALAKHSNGDFILRIKIPKGEKVTFRDYVLEKEITWDTNTLTDLVLLKSDGYPTYHLAVVVDDNDMGITHVLRGHDWLPSTPLHLLSDKFLGYKIPEIGHLTDILDPEGGKLSKRKGSTSCKGLMKEGYLPEAILNFVMLLGWAPKDNREIFTLDEFVETFDPKGFQKSNPIFNREKLDWFNQQYLEKLSEEKFILHAKALSDYADNENFEFIAEKTASFMPSRIKNIQDYDRLTKFFFERPEVNKSLFGKNYKEHLVKALDAIEKGIPLDQVPKENNFRVGDFFMDLRIAITGSKFTPPINESIEVLGEEESV